MRILRIAAIAVVITALPTIAHAVIVGGGDTGCCGGVTNASPVRYIYTGNPFNIFEPGVPEGVDRISAVFGLQEPLPPNFSGSPPSSEFSISDGVSSFDNVDFNDGGFTFLRVSFFVETDENAMISNWSIGFLLAERDAGQNALLLTESGDPMDPESGPVDSTLYCVDSGGLPTDPIICQSLLSVKAEVFESPGTWEMQIIPIPAAIWLLGSALGILGYMRRRQS